MAESHGTVTNSEPVNEQLSEKYAGKKQEISEKIFVLFEKKNANGSRGNKVCIKIIKIIIKEWIKRLFAEQSHIFNRSQSID